VENENLAKKGGTKTRPGGIPTSNLKNSNGDAAKGREIRGVYGVFLKLAELELKSARVVL